MINTWKTLLFASGLLAAFCAILYDAVWTRLAFSHFGSTMSMLTVVMTSCLLGAIVGAYAGGRWVGNWCERFKASPIVIFACAEALAGFGALLVPFYFQIVQNHLTAQGALSVSQFSITSGFFVFAILFPISF